MGTCGCAACTPACSATHRRNAQNIVRPRRVFNTNVASSSTNRVTRSTSDAGTRNECDGAVLRRAPRTSAASALGRRTGVEGSRAPAVSGRGRVGAFSKSGIAARSFIAHPYAPQTPASETVAIRKFDKKRSWRSTQTDCYEVPLLELQLEHIYSELCERTERRAELSHRYVSRAPYNIYTRALPSPSEPF
ncbi:hypothetical protein EVAR_37111_1 [Eumeta japonica]|uniref:Uncharacterized protein n=1 Tax=Eumeta variegata TaxID=151549 RepID=A0A4C1XQD5_EUMVA|nr:hypothetical protein EVAR_37111_1 [Eumeta japonica]